MKTVINISLAGYTFPVEDDGYQRLDAYLKEFRSKSGSDVQARELMEDLELRIADIFKDLLASTHTEVVTRSMVDDVINRIGMPDGSAASESQARRNSTPGAKPSKKFYRDPDDKKIAGVCSGLAAYLDVDVTLIRVVFLVTLICGAAGFWIYVIFWIIAPLAHNAVQKCEMRGIEATDDNLRQFSTCK